MSPKHVLISIHPKYAEGIFSGGKTMELRKTRPRIESGDMLIVYSTSPEMELRGRCSVVQVVSGSPEDLWLLAQDRANIDEKDFREYFGESEIGYGIIIDAPEEFAAPASLEDIRTAWPTFHPPQTYHYLNGERVDLLLGLTCCFDN